MRHLPDGVLVVTDRHAAGRPLTALIGVLVGAGARWVWLRDRDLAADARRRLARDLLSIVRPAGARLTIGADVPLAEAVAADGVHLREAHAVAPARERLGPQALIGVSTHSLAEVDQAAEAGADYVTLSPIFASSSKPGYGPPLGLRAISRAARRGIPVLALGGVCPANAAACRAAGAAGVAVMGALMQAESPADTYRELASATGQGSRAAPVSAGA